MGPKLSMKTIQQPHGCLKANATKRNTWLVYEKNIWRVLIVPHNCKGSEAILESCMCNACVHSAHISSDMWKNVLWLNYLPLMFIAALNKKLPFFTKLIPHGTFLCLFLSCHNVYHAHCGKCLLWEDFNCLFSVSQSSASTPSASASQWPTAHR